MSITKPLFLLPLIATMACGPGSVPESDAFACVDSETLCVTLQVPENYDGAPRELATGFYDSDNTNRPPNEVLAAIEFPSIIAGENYELSHAEVDFTGDYYLLFILYDEDGGTWVPQAGVDYTAMTSEPVRIDGNPIDLGTLTLELAD